MNQASRPHTRASFGARAAVLTAATALLMTGLTGTANAEPLLPDGPQRPEANLSAEQQAQLAEAVAARRALPASGPMGFLLELNTPASGQVYTQNLPRGTGTADSAATAAVQTINAMADQAVASLTQVAPGATELYRTQAALASVAVTADVTAAEALAGLPNVRAVHPIAPKVIDNAGAAQLTRSAEVWADLGNTGEGVSIGILDTGIDYVHTGFGGAGTPDAYALQTDAVADPSVYPTAKVVGGFDLVGDAYDADPSGATYNPVPRPDPNPMDCNGHGSHVGGSAGGYGVNADGTTYTGPYDETTPLNEMRIGPGMAPNAELWGLRVFGCNGSTNVTSLAIDYALDPNRDGITSDHLDIVNLSLGSDFGLADDADTLVANRASQLGMLMVIASGNAGDTFDVGGSPGNAPRALTVAASNDGYGIFDGWQITSPAGVFDPAIRPGLRSVAYVTPTPDGVSGELALPVDGDDPTACDPLTGDYTGKYLIIQAAEFACGSVTKGGNAAAAGATGFVIVSDDDLLEVGITGDTTIPGILVTASDGAVLVDRAATETLTITFGDNLRDAATYINPDQEDLLASFSSRGVRGANGVKPDVAAPGVTVFSVATGTGTEGVNNSGTSMATPVTAGISALIRMAHPDWTVEEIKAAVMNTANSDVYTELGQSGDTYAPNRVGSGRVDARQALATNVVAYTQEAAGGVSASFGTIEAVNETTTAARTIRLVNKGTTAQTFEVSYDPATETPGVSFSLNKSSVTIAPGSSATVIVTVTITRSQLAHTLDPTMTDTQATELGVELPRQYLSDASGLVVMTALDAAQPGLRVPVHVNAKPSSTLTQTLSTFSGDSAELTLSGVGVANGTLGEPSASYSTVSAYEQLGTSPQMAQCSRTVRTDCYASPLERSVDLRAVGVSTDAPFSQNPGDPLAEGYLYFGIGAYGIASNPTSVINYSIIIDANNDTIPDYELFTYRLYNGVDPTDVVIVLGTDLATGDNLTRPNGDLAFEFLNGASGQFDLNTFDTDVVQMPFPLSAMPLISEASPRFTFGALSVSGVTGVTDEIGFDPATSSVAGGMSYNAVTPGLSLGIDGGVANMYLSEPGMTIDVTRDAAEYAADVAVGGDRGILMVHSHNSTGAGRAQTVAVPAAP